MKKTSGVASLLCTLVVTSVGAYVVGCELDDPGLVTPRDSGSPDVLEPGTGGAPGSGGRGGSGGTSGTSGGGAATSGGRAANGGTPPLPDASLGGADAGADASSSSDADACPPHHAVCDAGSGGCGANLDTDPHHCGRCGHDCLGGDCTDGICGAVRVAPPTNEDGFPKALAVDGAGVYFSRVRAFGAMESGIFSCPLTGCGLGAPTVLTLNTGEPQSILVHANTMYWSDGAGSRMVLCPTSGCASSPDTCAIDQPAPGAIATDGESLYWSNQGTGPKGYTDGTIMKASIATDGGTCGAPETLAAVPRRPADMTLDGGTLYWITDPSDPLTADGALYSCSSAGCSQKPTTVAPALIRPAAVTAQAGAVFWASDSTHETNGQCKGDGAIYTCKNCKGVPRSLQQNMSCPSHITSDAEHVYWIETDATGYNCQLDRMNLDGSGFEAFALTNIAMLNIAVDDKAVYWLLLSGEVYKRAKD